MPIKMSPLNAKGYKYLFFKVWDTVDVFYPVF